MSSSRTVRLFEQRMSEVLDLRVDRIREIFRGARPTSIRVNRLLDDATYAETVAAVEQHAPSAVAIDWCDHAYLWPEADGFEELLALAHLGRVYLQNASSLIPPVALDPQPGDRILDVAAAPGGKAFHLAARVGNQGSLWLNDNAAPRAAKMAALAGTYGVEFEECTTYAAQYLDKSLPPESFDRILLDVQCSGEGRVDLRKPVTLKHWSEERIEKYKFMQTKMLTVAYKLLKPGGTMVYSTCTLSPEEDELPVSKNLERHADLTIEPLGFSEPMFRSGLKSWHGTSFDKRVRDTVRVEPSDLFEGFFVARLKKG